MVGSACFLAVRSTQCVVSVQLGQKYVSSPHVFARNAGIFGLTGSVGGKAESSYLAKTYQTLKLDAPRFLETCVGEVRRRVVNHGVCSARDEDELLARVVGLAESYFRKVPVLVIASSLDQLAKLNAALRCSTLIPAEEVQQLTQFDAQVTRDRGACMYHVMHACIT